MTRSKYSTTYPGSDTANMATPPRHCGSCGHDELGQSGYYCRPCEIGLTVEAAAQDSTA